MSVTSNRVALYGSDYGASRSTVEWLIYPIMLGIGFIGGLHHVGIGFFMITALRHLMKMDLVRINMHKAAVFFIYTIPAILVFALTGNIDWRLGIVLAAGNATGGWWAAKVAVRRGEKDDPDCVGDCHAHHGVQIVLEFLTGSMLLT